MPLNMLTGLAFKSDLSFQVGRSNYSRYVEIPIFSLILLDQQTGQLNMQPVPIDARMMMMMSIVLIPNIYRIN